MESTTRITKPGPSVTGTDSEFGTAPKSEKPKSEPGAKVSDKDFEEVVLERHGITIQHRGPCQDIIGHFGLEGKPETLAGRLDLYKTEFPDLKVWLSPDNKDDIAMEYRVMEHAHMNEATFSAKAMQFFFRSEVLNELLSVKRFVPYRTFKLFLKRDKDNMWQAPPPVLVYTHPKEYKWDLRTDASYYVSIEAFKPLFHAELDGYASVVYERATCPYFTVDIKKREDELIAMARCQVAAFGAMALYNRYQLKCRSLKANKHKPPKNWSQEDKEQMEHYGATFTGAEWIIWCIRPKTLPQWTGCTMAIIDQGDCTTVEGVELLLGILNDIHYWGMKIHGQSCKGDIESCHYWADGSNKSRVSEYGTQEPAIRLVPTGQTT
ncbi:hypothetical protein F4679DRAFT_598484 [Xylaria curta]|nr:hypothetical protein F4679DRAFT_598484 [Xylaria curta]